MSGAPKTKIPSALMRDEMKTSTENLQFIQGGLMELIKESRDYISLERKACDSEGRLCHSLQTWAQRALEQGRANETWSILKQFGNTLSEIELVKRSMMDAYEGLVENLAEYDANIAQCLSMQKDIAVKRETYDAAMARLSKAETKGAAKPKMEAEAAQTRQQFELIVFDYCDKLERLDVQQHSLLTSAYCQHYISLASAYKHGTAILEDQQSFALEVSDRIAVRKAALRDQSAEDKKLALASRLAEISASGGHAPEEQDRKGIEKEGYLWKRGKNIGTKRRWFVVRDGTLEWFKSWDDFGKPLGALPLLFCTARAHDDPKENTFEIVSRTKSLTLQAESKADLMAWLAVIQNAITQGLNTLNADRDGPSANVGDPKENPESVSTMPTLLVAIDRHILQFALTDALQAWNRVREFSDANRFCADCGAEDPTWASINHGVTLCIGCSGAHRFLGVVISKVRSLTLDTWDAETLGVMEKLGNNVVNPIYEAKRVGSTSKTSNVATSTTHVNNLNSTSTNNSSTNASESNSETPPLSPRDTVAHLIAPDAPREAREAYIAAKYSQKAFVQPDDNEKKQTREQLSQALLETTELPKLARLLALGADINYGSTQRSGTLLHKAALRNDAVVAEWAILNGASLKAANDKGDTPLHVSVRSDDCLQAVALLIRRGTDLSLQNARHHTALDAARKSGAVKCTEMLNTAQKARDKLEAELYDNDDDDTPSSSATNSARMPLFVGGSSSKAVKSPKKSNSRRKSSVANSAKIELKKSDDVAPRVPPIDVSTPQLVTGMDNDEPVAVSSPRWAQVRGGRPKSGKTAAQLAEGLATAAKAAAASLPGAVTPREKASAHLQEYDEPMDPVVSLEVDSDLNTSGRRRKKITRKSLPSAELKKQQSVEDLASSNDRRPSSGSGRMRRHKSELKVNDDDLADPEGVLDEMQELLKKDLVGSGKKKKKVKLHRSSSSSQTSNAVVANNDSHSEEAPPVPRTAPPTD